MEKIIWEQLHRLELLHGIRHFLSWDQQETVGSYVREKLNTKKYFAGIGALCNFILNIVLISLIGMNGAAIATLLTQIITNFVAPAFFKETRENSKFIVQAFVLKDLLKNMRNKGAI